MEDNEWKKKHYNIKEVIKVTKESLSKPGFESLLNFNDVLSLEELKKYLTEKIAVMLEKNFDLLLSSLYRIDIDEHKVKELFSGKRRENIRKDLLHLLSKDSCKNYTTAINIKVKIFREIQH